MRRIILYILTFQGVYYLVTALWPVINLESFLLFVGPKPDRFIFWTVDLLIIAIGSTILLGVRNSDQGTTTFLGIISAIAFMTVELIFAGKISPFFWVDFTIESLIFLGLTGSSLLLARQ